MVLGDFAEDYQYRIQDEMQSFHWSKEYCTLHPLVMYFEDADGNLERYSLFFISDDNTHETSFVHKIRTLLVEFLKQRLSNVTKIYYVSDGCGGQYKNFKNFLNICSHKEDFSIEAEWILFATSHRKSWCDGIGGPVECHAEKRFEDGNTVPSKRSSHYFIPQSASQIGHKLCSKDHSFVDIHDFKIPTRAYIGDIAPSSYISCMYNSLWWVGLVNEVDEEQGDVDLQFMHPHGPRKTFNLPQGGDSYYVPIKNIVCAIQAPTTTTGRTYRICDEDYDKTVAAFAKLHS